MSYFSGICNVILNSCGLKLKKYLISGLLGFLATLALPPFFIAPFLIIAFSGFLSQLSNSKSMKDAFLTGWAFGAGHFITGLYWITISLFVDIKSYFFLIPFALLGIGAFLGLITAIIAIIDYKLRFKSWQKIINFATLWIAGEYIRSFIFTGFPWNLIGYSFTFSDNIIQITSIIGIYGLSYITILISSSFYILINKIGLNEESLKDQDFKSANLYFSFIHTSKTKPARKTIPHEAITPIIYSMMLLSFIFIAGNIRLLLIKDSDSEYFVRVVQGNIPINEKWDPKTRQSGVEKYIKLSQENSTKPIDYIIWPESATPYDLPNETELSKILFNLNSNKSYLITGALRTKKTQKEFKIWNSLFVMNSTSIIDYYDKKHLVPFGEYIPFRDILPMNKITYGTIDYSSGKKKRLIKIDDNNSFIPLICYEAIFPWKLNDNNADFIVNITNDGWFGTSTGPYQHLYMVKIRAVEQGLPLIRAANTGISAVIDSYGKIIKSLSLNTEGIIDVELPPKLKEKTFYSKHGEYTLLIIVYLLLLTTMVKRNSD